jgi:hypothetical protein
MTYSDRFALVEDYLAHVDPLMTAITDPFVEARYTGFIATSAVTAYELAIKDIFYAFADKKHAVLGEVTRARFFRLNGKIKFEDLKKDHIKMFGMKYIDRFVLNIEKADREYIRDHGKSPKAAYNNIITWRNQFVHEGTLPNTTNYAEIKDQYMAGKEVVHCLFKSMVR